MRMELVEKKLERIYGDAAIAARTAQLLKNSLSDFVTLSPKEGLSEKDCILITYADSILQKGKRPLVSLSEFLDAYVKDAIGTIHILPFFPSTSDDGFSVVDYDQVNPGFGDWDDVVKIADHYGLMIDSVANHVSKSSRWFQGYLNGEKPYTDYFIISDPNADYSSVTRPRALPLLTKFQTSEGEKFLWTTFSDDQIDLNYKSPDLLVEVIRSILNYAYHGARFIRLDAIGFIWKELGTCCMHLPQCHEIIKLIRIILEDYAPGVMLITETNVPQEDNICYFGEDDEAMMVYQFPLPPLVMYTLVSGSSRHLSDWVKNLYRPQGKSTYLNFLASHDGIGLRPVDGILNDEERNLLVKTCLENGGKVSYRDNGDGSKSPYELNIVYLDALVHDYESDEIKQAKFLAAMTILLSLQGVPGIYIHSLLGSRNDYNGMNTSGIPRRINREKLDYCKLTAQLEGDSFCRGIFDGLINLLKTRRLIGAFSPYASQRVLEMGDKVFAIERTNENDSILVLVNISAEEISLEMDGLTGEDVIGNGSIGPKVNMKPYQCLWIKK